MNAEFYEWLDARPMETAIDLSKAGEMKVPFHQTCGVSHGEALYFDADVPDEVKEHPEKLLENLSGSIFIRDIDGNEIASAEFVDKSVQFWDGEILLAGFAPFPKGDYDATIRIEAGVPALADKPQTIYAKYQLCGLEQMPAMITGVFAVGSGMIGLISAICVLPGLLRFGVRRPMPSQAPQA